MYGKVPAFEIPHKYLTHTLKDMIFIPYWKLKSSQIYKLICVFQTLPVISNNGIHYAVFHSKGFQVPVPS